MHKLAKLWLSCPLMIVCACSTSNSTGGDTPDAAAPTGDAAIPHSPSPDLAGLGGPGTVVLVNTCTQPIWVGALHNGSSTFTPDNGGWKMEPGGVHVVSLPAKWGGRFWGRTGCTFDQNGMGKCETGDCGGKLGCTGSGKPPASLVEFQMNGFGGKDFYDVSLVDGYNLPIAVAPQAGTFTRGNNPDQYDCGAPTCSSDVNAACPDALKQIVGGRVVGCRSAHQACTTNPTDPALACATVGDLYDCSKGGPNAVSGSCYSPGADNKCCGCPSWSEAGTCNAHNPKWEAPALPEVYAKPFKTACPTAYSFPYDDPTSTFTCQASSAQGTGYQITFCP